MSSYGVPCDGCRKVFIFYADHGLDTWADNFPNYYRMGCDGKLARLFPDDPDDKTLTVVKDCTMCAFRGEDCSWGDDDWKPRDGIEHREIKAVRVTMRTEAEAAGSGPRGETVDEPGPHYTGKGKGRAE